MSADVKPLEDAGYILIARKSNCDIYVTEKHYDCSGLSVVEINGSAYIQKPSFEQLDGAGQYAFNEDGRIYIAV